MHPASPARHALSSVAGCAIGLAVLLLLSGCQFPTTVYGRLVLKSGEEGDVRLARIELRDSAAWDSAPVYAIAPGSGGVFYRAPFEFPVVAPGPYYLLAWQDRDADGRISDGDLAGVYRDTLHRDYPGAPLMVYQGWTVNAGDIEMATYDVLEIAAAGARSPAGDTTSFTYSFNHDVQLNSLAIAFPGQPALPDPGAAGIKIADSTYLSGGWSFGSQMPGGMHQLEFRGVFKDSTFALRVAILVE